jgi:hypothetical protein
MAVSYLARAGRRTAAEPAPGVRPAMPSRSPIVEADQRLNVDAFAQHFGAWPAAPPIAEEREAPGEVQEAGVVPEPRSNRPLRRRIAATRAGTSRVREADVPDQQPPMAPPIRRVTQSDVTPERQRPIVREIRRARRANRESSDAPQRESSGALHRTPGEPAHRRHLLPSATIFRETHTVTPGSTQAGGREHARVDTTPRASLEPSMKSVLEAVKRATSWIEAGERRAEPSDDASRLRSSARAEDARALVRRRQTVTHLEIGRIDVEVVAPTKPAPPASRSQSALPSSGALGVSRPVFGWRQR